MISFIIKKHIIRLVLALGMMLIIKKLQTIALPIPSEFKLQLMNYEGLCFCSSHLSNMNFMQITDEIAVTSYAVTEKNALTTRFEIMIEEKDTKKNLLITEHIILNLKNFIKKSNRNKIIEFRNTNMKQSLLNINQMIDFLKRVKTNPLPEKDTFISRRIKKIFNLSIEREEVIYNQKGFKETGKNSCMGTILKFGAISPNIYLKTVKTDDDIVVSKIILNKEIFFYNNLEEQKKQQTKNLLSKLRQNGQKILNSIEEIKNKQNTLPLVIQRFSL